MIGLVLSKQVLPQIAGYTPLPLWKVRAIKAVALARFNAGMLYGIAAFLSPLLGGIVLLVAGGIEEGLALSVIGLVATFALLWAATHTKEEIFLKWKTSNTVETTGRAWYFADRTRYWQLIPEAGGEIVANLKAAGIQPQVEYIKDDPFIFVDLPGDIGERNGKIYAIPRQRVYLYHW